MSAFRRPILIALASVAVMTAGPAMAGSNSGGGVGGVLNAYDYPPNTEPGQCYARRVTGAGGAYRWDTVACDSAYGGYGYGYGQSGYGGVQVQVQDGYDYQAGYTADCGCAGLRYPPPCDSRAGYGGGYSGGYAYGEGYGGDRYGERRGDIRYSQYQYAYQRSAYGGGYAHGRGGQGENYPPPYGYGASYYGYGAAGRDEAGYLIWPGKTP